MLTGIFGFIKTTGNYLKSNLLYGIKPAIIAIILGAISSGKKSLKQFN
jgi:chromate transport protein ChrA